MCRTGVQFGDYKTLFTYSARHMVARLVLRSSQRINHYVGPFPAAADRARQLAGTGHIKVNV